MTTQDDAILIILVICVILLICAYAAIRCIHLYKKNVRDRRRVSAVNSMSSKGIVEQANV